jgi:hypothetical protein
MRLDDALRLSLAIATSLDSNHSLRAIVCFTQAHYLMFRAEGDSWLCIDDDKPVQRYELWSEVVHRIVDEELRPTLLLYEKIETQIK